ncbi:MAG: ATP-dependent protease La, partial [Caulobacter sp.]|nr:ATP-dependent protease La [Caulobacter sp.]
SGIKTVLIPQENEKDLADVPENVKSQLEIIPVATFDQAVKLALTKPLTPIEWTDEDQERAMRAMMTPPGPDGDNLVTH